MMTDVTFVARCDGTEQKYVLVLPAGFAGEAGCEVLIALHGHGSDRWQFATGEDDQFRAVREVAARRGMILVSPDYRAPASWMGPTAEADLVQIIEEVREKYRASRVQLCGGSMGGASCLAFAALHPELLDGVASMNGMANYLEFENFGGSIAESFGGTKDEIPLEYKRRSAEYWPERLTMRIGMVVSGKDESVPPHSVLRLAKVLEAIGHPAMKLIYRPDMGHGVTHEDVESALEFIFER